MRWLRDREIWLAGLAGFLLAMLAADHAEAAPPAVARPAPEIPARLGWHLALLCLVLALGGAALVIGEIEESRQDAAVARALTGGEPSRGPVLMTRYGCAGCHTIPDVPGADGQVGPALAGLRKRVFVGGVARNSASNLIDWIVNPRALSPRTAMPVTGISVSEARDVAAFLYSQ